jgi:hypothetical protein
MAQCEHRALDSRVSTYKGGPMISVRRLQRLVAPLLVTSIVGCAPAYRSYSGCYVECK